MNGELGKYAFLGGLLFSVVIGLFQAVSSYAWLVALLAVIVAFMNIQAKETMKLLLWTIGMGVFGVGALATSFAAIPVIGETLGSIISNLGIFFMTIAGVFLLKIGYAIFSK